MYVYLRYGDCRKVPRPGEVLACLQVPLDNVLALPHSLLPWLRVDLATSATVALGWAGIPILPLPLPLPLPASLPSTLPSWHWQHSRNLHFGDFDFVA